MGGRFSSILAILALLSVGAAEAGQGAGSTQIPPLKPAVPAAVTTTAALPGTPPVSGAGTAGAIAVTLDAIIAAGGKPIADKIDWTVAKADATGEVVATQTSAKPKFSLAPGKYKVTAEYGQVKVTKDLSVGTSPGKQTINLGAAYLNVKMIPHAGAPAITDDVTWELYVYAKGAAENGKKLLSAVAPTQAYVLPAGAYVVRAMYAGTSADLVVPLEPGQGYNYTINLYAGTLAARAVKPSGGELVGEVRWEILSAKPDKDGQRKLVAWAIGAKHSFTLREGKYIAVARSSNMSSKEEFEVKAGKTKKVKLVLKPGVDQVPAAKAPAAAAVSG